MANEFLARTPTSTGNRRVWTFSCWIKSNQNGNQYIFGAFPSGNSAGNQFVIAISNGNNFAEVFQNTNNVTEVNAIGTAKHRDNSAWINIVVCVNTTLVNSGDRIKYYVNGALDQLSGTFPSQNFQFNANNVIEHLIGNWPGLTTDVNSQLTDIFFVDGQALTPDVFGFNKVGKGYISSGSTVATDFKPGQWVPKSPRIIIADINSRGGFGVNGFYLPMNDSNNFGADFHCTPNSIIKLQENLPQPRCRIDGVGDYTGALRDDPFKQYLVLALPFVSGGLQNGFGDYSAAIRGTGTPKTLTLNGGIVTSSTHSYYGSAGYFNNGGTSGSQFLNCTDSDFALGTSNFTLEAWIYPTSIYNYWTLLSTRPSDGSFGDAYHIGTDANGALGFYSNEYDARSANGIIIANQWSHIAACRIWNTLTLYVNGVAVAVNPNYTKNLTRNALSIGRLQNFGTNFESATGYIQDLRIYKGVAKYTGGFDVPRPYTPVGISSWRAVPDTTANNFATLNPLGGDGTLSGGNLKFVAGGIQSRNTTFATTGNGKWYVEFRTGNVQNGTWEVIGIHPINKVFGPDRAYAANGQYWNGGAWVSFGTAWSNGDIIGLAYNQVAGEISFYLNGTLQGTTQSYTSSEQHYFVVRGNSGTEIICNFGQNSTFSGNTTAGTFADSNGKGLFKYQPPAGFLALCEDNLPTPAISDPGKHFKTVLYTGDGTGGRSITGVGFQPDFVWIKTRVSGYHQLMDSVRGAGKQLYSNTDLAEAQGNFLTSFDNDGFSINWNNSGAVNASGTNYVAWCWKAGNTSTTNTNGSITSTVSVNQQAGFSIVSWTGNGASTVTVGHGLGKTPAFMILKARDAGSADSNWVIFHKSMGSGTFDKYMYFTTGGAGTLVPSLPANSSIFTSSNPGINSNNIRYITYCWTEIDGFSKFGSYVGNGSVDGPFVYCGFKPAFILIKSSSASYNWYIIDNARSSTNPANSTLAPNTANIEDNGWNGVCDLLSNGFKIRESNAAVNASGETYIFAAFAESAFSYSNAK